MQRLTLPVVINAKTKHACIYCVYVNVQVLSLPFSLSLYCTVCICFRCADHPVTSWNESWHGHAEDYNGCPKGTANLHKPGKTSTVDFFEDTNAVERWNGIVIFFNMLFEQLNIGCPFGAPKSNDLLCRYVLLCFLHIFPMKLPYGQISKRSWPVGWRLRTKDPSPLQVCIRGAAGTCWDSFPFCLRGRTLNSLVRLKFVKPKSSIVTIVPFL
jgi:hypothetical protein